MTITLEYAIRQHPNNIPKENIIFAPECSTNNRYDANIPLYYILCSRKKHVLKPAISKMNKEIIIYSLDYK